MPTLNTILRARLQNTQFEKFKAIAAAKSMTTSEFIRQIVLIVIGESEIRDEAIKPSPKNAELMKITVRIPNFMLDEVKVRGKLKGMTISRWISSLVQSHLLNEPVMTSNEMIMLNANIRELAALGRNLNQIAKSLNERFYETDQVKLSLLKELQAAIENNEISIRKLISASNRAWEARNSYE